MALSPAGAFVLTHLNQASAPGLGLFSLPAQPDHMDLQAEDIRLLYGELLFLVPAEGEEIPVPEPPAEAPRSEMTVEEPEPEVIVEEPQAEPEPPGAAYLLEGPMVDWKMKPQAKVALVLSALEFSDRDLTRQLRDMVLAADLDANLIGFGVLPAGSDRWNFAGMPVDLAIVCHTFPERLPQPVSLGGKQFFVAAPLTQIAADDRYRQAMDRLLARVRQALG
ncbi:MAG: hypothetical protein D6722_26950 [Bacteroidetes bacterium]|nr:MAG: hypothetical protein D6722_26950 [Bacteroidota bacterium]